MGWASGGYIFSDVVDACLHAGVRGDQLRIIASATIASLQSGDWDTEGEALGEYDEYPEIVDAFRENGVINECYEEPDVNERHLFCRLELNHEGLHEAYDWIDKAVYRYE